MANIETKYKYKMIVVVDNNIKMHKGKLAREVAGAVTLAIMYHFISFKWVSLIRWYKNGIKTVVLKTYDMEGLIIDLSLYKQFYLTMVDSGATVFKKPTRTCIVLPVCKEENSLIPIKKLKLL